MRTLVALIYLGIVLLACALSLPFPPGESPPWLGDAPNPVMSWASRAEALTEATFTYRQGPRRRGIAENEILPLNLEKVWQTEAINHGIHAASKASPAVDESGVYVGGDTGWFYRFSHEGKLIWKLRTDRAQLGIHGTAALDGNFVYFGAYNGLFYCLDKTDGSMVWSIRLGDAIGSSPVMDGEFIYVSAETAMIGARSSPQAMYGFPARDGRLFKLERRTGNVVWRGPWVGEQIHSSPTLFDEGRKIGVGDNKGFYHAYATGDGRELWRTDAGGEIKGTAVADRGRLYFGTYGRNLVALDASNGKILWTRPLAGISQSSPVLIPDENLLVTGSHENGEWVVVRAEDGELLWRIPSGSSLSRASPIAVRPSENGPWLVWTTCQGEYLCALHPKSAKVLGRWPLDHVFTGEPTVFRGRLYIALNEGGVWAFAAKAQRSTSSRERGR